MSRQHLAGPQPVGAHASTVSTARDHRSQHPTALGQALNQQPNELDLRGCSPTTTSANAGACVAVILTSAQLGGPMPIDADWTRCQLRG